MRNQLRGCIKINASGKKLYTFINKIHSGRIYCFGQYCRKDTFYAEIYRHDLKKVQEFAEECGVELKHYECETISSKLIRYRKRIGIFIGAAIAAVSVWYFSSVVMTIEVQGNSDVSESVILAALEELDIKQGTFINDIDFKYCENELRIMVDGISWAGIRHTGNRVVVEVTEIVESPEMLRDRQPCNVVAAKSAQITYTSVYDGQLMRIVGDYVIAGDMLISGVIEDGAGHVTKHHAMGKITGIYEETVTFAENYKSEQYLPTGNTTNEKYLRLFNVRIPLFIGKNKYSSYTSDKKENRLVVLGRELPIGIENEEYTETRLKDKEYTDSELEEKIMEKIYLYEKNFLSEQTIILREIEQEKTDESLIYNVRYKLEGDIGIQKEIFLK
ncbi:MAG: hypothetical protein E7497_02955 [Ruminococcus sp.]|nr:hypothetical protein [Ruminococcus sp.]